MRGSGLSLGGGEEGPGNGTIVSTLEEASENRELEKCKGRRIEVAESKVKCVSQAPSTDRNKCRSRNKTKGR